MKRFSSAIVLAVVLFTSMSGNAETLGEKRIREVMLNRVDSISKKVLDAREDLDNNRIREACNKIGELFEAYRDHVHDVGVRLHPYEKKTSEVRNVALYELIQLHKERNNCRVGRDQEAVDPEVLADKLKDISKSLKRQRKVIAKKDVSYNNEFHYDYEF